ncbi:DUF3558 domain-containing protein [Nocardia sp. 2]|uniref:DUF3558 domain-containing protein n=1 Tax=Nocardia acididurans TaxID=2802282 RepID=A0ABS1MC45_9NOCA|nr:DUF3558 domain-containing protein [Nocardia acididurans]MBL1078222.1 DUF3558 domain-containing protein [Nocardia acididurans]
MKRIVHAAGLTLVAALLATACSGDDGAGEATTTRSAPAASGAFLGECGGLTDDEVRQITGFPNLVAYARNGIKCRWESQSGELRVMFTWYRGSPIERERTVAKVSGKDMGDLEIDGHPGFTANDTQLCQGAVQDGADFFHWLIAGPGAEPCDALRTLAGLTLERSRG